MLHHDSFIFPRKQKISPSKKKLRNSADKLAIRVVAA
jgi:hypothetical protein